MGWGYARRVLARSWWRKLAKFGKRNRDTRAAHAETKQNTSLASARDLFAGSVSGLGYNYIKVEG